MSRKMRSLPLSAFSFFFVGIFSPPAYSWEQNDLCGAGSVDDEYISSTYTYNISTTDFPTSGDLYSALSSAGPYWGDGFGFPIPGTDLHVYKGANTTVDEQDYGDGVESVTLQYPLEDPDYGAQVLRVCGTNSFDEFYVECDILLSTARDWYSGVPHKAEDSNDRSIQATLIHEIGHCLGFAHEEDFPDTMNHLNPHSGNLAGTVAIAENARVGARYVYYDSTTGTDLSLSILRRSGYNSEGSIILDYIPFSDSSFIEKTYLLFNASNRDINRRYCLHNLGTTSVTVYYNIYLSQDDGDIEITDTVLGTFGATLDPDTPYCEPQTVTIPSGLSLGYYTIGAIVDPWTSSDPDGYITESVETNNVVEDSTLFEIR